MSHACLAEGARSAGSRKALLPIPLRAGEPVRAGQALFLWVSLSAGTKIPSSSDVLSFQKCLTNSENNFRVYFENLDVKLKRRKGPPTVPFSQALVLPGQLCGHPKKLLFPLSATEPLPEAVPTPQCEALGKSDVGPDGVLSIQNVS